MSRPFRVQLKLTRPLPTYECPGCGSRWAYLTISRAIVKADRHARACMMLELLNRNPWLWAAQK